MKDEEKYLEDEMEKFGERWPYPSSFDGYDKDWVDELAEECAKHFYELGKKDMKDQMLKEAVEGRVFMSFAPGHNQMVMADVDLQTNTKVKIIIVKED